MSLEKQLERKLNNWKIIGKFETKEELLNKVEELLKSQQVKFNIKPFINFYKKYLDFKKDEEYAVDIKNMDVDIYKDIVEIEKKALKLHLTRLEARRKAQKNMSVDDYRIVQCQKQAEHLVKREMKRMAKMIGRKKLLSYEPKVYVLNNWKDESCGGYVNKNNQIFLPKVYFKTKNFYDPFSLNPKKIIYRKNEELVKIIRHELTHLFVKEEFKNEKIKGINSDASPIFLYHLSFFHANFGSGYKVQSKHEIELRNEIQWKNRTYEDIKNKCCKLLGRIELILEQYMKYGCIVTFTTDEEETNVNSFIVNLGYEVVNYKSEDFIKVTDELLYTLNKEAKRLGMIA